MIDTTDKGPRPPRTPSGIALHEDWHASGECEGGCIIAPWIAKIEAEATAPDAGLREALERIKLRAKSRSLSGLAVRPEAALSAIYEEADVALAAHPAPAPD